jgi:type II secretory pathway component PulC
MKQIRHSPLSTFENTSYSKNSIADQDVDTSSLILKYRDPFLNTVARKCSDSGQSGDLNGSSTAHKSVTKVPVNFPDTKYSGLIVNSKNKQKLGIIKIGKKDFLAKEGEMIEGEKILKLYNDSVIISFNKAKKTFFRD